MEQENKPSVKEIEKAEEEKLKALYPNIGQKGSSILQKRMNKNVKYFDSGDYNMAKSKVLHQQQAPSTMDSTGDAIPTPDTLLAVRKKSMLQACPPHLVYDQPISPPATAHSEAPKLCQDAE